LISTYAALFGTQLGVIPFKFYQDFWHQKARVLGVAFMILH